MKSILVVDDNIMMRRLIINLFSRDEFVFDEASDGREGLDKMSDNHYDLVITDIVMPKMEGIEMILQAKRIFPGIKIIAISGGEPFYLYLAKKLGIQGIFTKPLNRQGFLSAVNSNL
jgi:two-component system nitrogen regulation response regulator NtrX